MKCPKFTGDVRGWRAQRVILKNKKKKTSENSGQEEPIYYIMHNTSSWTFVDVISITGCYLA